MPYFIPRLSQSTAELLQSRYVVAYRQDWSVIKASETGVRKYLQGQITQDMDKLTCGQGIHTCILKPQGKAVNELYILEGNDDELILLAPSAHAVSTVARLRQFALGYTLRIGVVDDWGILDIQGADSAEALKLFGLSKPLNGYLSTSHHNNLHAITLLNQPDGFQVIGNKTKLESLLQNSGWMSGNPTLSPFSGWNALHGGSMERNSSPEMGQSGEADRRSRVLQEALDAAFESSRLKVLDAEEVEALRIIRGIPRFGTDWNEKIYPMNANMIEFDSVSFDKGCYVGQEVTSRMHWRGGVKKRFYRVKLGATPDVLPCPISTTASIGVLTSAATDAHGVCSGIAHLPIEVAGSDATLSLEHGVTVHVIEACHA